MKPTRHSKLVYKSSDTSRTLLIKGEFQRRLKWFNLAASTVKAREEINRKNKVDVVSYLSHKKKLISRGCAAILINNAAK